MHTVSKILNANLLHSSKCVHYMRTWESVACVHTVISSGHTRFLAQGLLTHFTNTQITIQLGMYSNNTNIKTSGSESWLMCAHKKCDDYREYFTHNNKQSL